MPLAPTNATRYRDSIISMIAGYRLRIVDSLNLLTMMYGGNAERSSECSSRHALLSRKSGPQPGIETAWERFARTRRTGSPNT